MTDRTRLPLPEPAFRLFWKSGRYTVSKPNVDDCDCFNSKEMHAYAAAVSAADNAALRERVDVLWRALERTTVALDCAFSRLPLRDMTEVLAEARSALEVTHE